MYYCIHILIPYMCEGKLRSNINDGMILLIWLQNLESFLELFLESKFLRTELFSIAKSGLNINILLHFYLFMICMIWRKLFSIHQQAYFWSYFGVNFHYLNLIL